MQVASFDVDVDADAGIGFISIPVSMTASASYCEPSFTLRNTYHYSVTVFRKHKDQNQKELGTDGSVSVIIDSQLTEFTCWAANTIPHCAAIL